MGDAYGGNSAQVEWVIGRLRELPASAWRSLEHAHSQSPTLDAAEDALVTTLDETGQRQSWFKLRAEATTLARKAAAAYAAETDETARTLEHFSSVNAWDGQHEKSSVEILGPAHERGFIDAACGALGVVLSRPHIAEKEFARFWEVYEPVIGVAPRGSRAWHDGRVDVVTS